MIVELELASLVVPQGLLPRVLTGTVEEKVEEYKEMLEQGVEFDPIIVWKRGGEYWVVDGAHRVEAHRRAGRKTIKAKILELKDELEYRIEAIKANLKHGLPLQKEEKILLSQTLYKLGVSIPELRKLFGVAERTIYNWIAPIKEKEKEELKQKALELRKQGMTQEEIAKQLGVAQSTISMWENETRSQISNFAKIAIFDKDGTPTPESYRLLSEFIEEHEAELMYQSFNEVVKDRSLRDVLRFLNETVKKDFRRFIDDPYEKVRSYLQGMPPYNNISTKARRIFFDKAQAVFEELKKEHEEKRKLESLVLEKAKEILLDPDYVFSTWKSLRFELSRRGVGIYGHEELVDEILHQHADELLAVYKKIPEPTEESISEEEIKKIKEEVKEEKDRWRREYKTREAVRRLLREKGLRVVDSVVERTIKKVEELIRQEEWEKLEKIAEEIEQSMTDEEAERLREEYERTFGKKPQEQKKTKEKEKKEQSPPPIEDWYKNQLELLLMDMGIKLGWERTFQIVEEVFQKVREFSKNARRGW